MSDITENVKILISGYKSANDVAEKMEELYLALYELRHDDGIEFETEKELLEFWLTEVIINASKCLFELRV